MDEVLESNPRWNDEASIDSWEADALVMTQASNLVASSDGRFGPDFWNKNT